MQLNKHLVNRSLAAVGTGVAAAAGWAAYSALFVNHQLKLPKAIDAERHTFVTSDGTLSYYADEVTSGVPLVLIHSINAACSAYEVRPIFERYRLWRPVYALDLPGFGLSDRRERFYSPELYARVIEQFISLCVRRSVDLVALSLSCEFAARAAVGKPELFRSLVMISPTGFAGPREKACSEQRAETATPGRLHGALFNRLWSQAFYDLLVARPSIHYFLKKAFAGPADLGLEEYDRLTSHQPGARHAPLYFVSGKLFTPDIRERFYSHLTMPVLEISDQTGCGNLDALPAFVRRHPNWTAVRISETKGLPHFDRPPETFGAMDRFWSGLAQNGPHSGTPRQLAT